VGDKFANYTEAENATHDDAADLPADVERECCVRHRESYVSERVSFNEAEKIMKYLCMVYIDEEKLDALSESELDALDGESLAYDEQLRKSGHYLVSNALQSVQTATTIRLRKGKTFTTDGPFAETKEQLGGFIQIEASNLDEAIRIASKIPPARLGCIEVRPVKELTQPVAQAIRN